MPSRRQFIAGSVAAAGLCSATEIHRRSGTKLKIALNAYSFNQPLMAGTTTLSDVIDYCAAHDIEGVDLTGYYFPGYPKVPSDEYIYGLKRKAYLNGVAISGTGVRNDFTLANAAARKKEIQLVKDWVVVAEKLGAGFIRVFSGKAAESPAAFERTLEYMIPAFQECAAFGKEHGVILGLQHHNDFLLTAAQTIRVIDAVNSDWFSAVLDVGSLRQGDPYEEIAKLLPYACTWQVKENVWYGKKATPIDLAKLRTIIEKGGYRGYLPFEALGTADPAIVVAAFLEKLRKAMA
jgi:sugar phosphate isomerase/epimerase